MTVHRIRSKVLSAEARSQGVTFKVESVDRRYIDERLVDIQRRDPAAKILTIQVPGA